MKKKKKIKSSFQNLNANLKCTEWGENEIKDSINDDRKIDKSVLFRIQIKMSLQQSPATQRSVAKTHFPIKNQFPSFCRTTDFFFGALIVYKLILMCFSCSRTYSIHSISQQKLKLALVFLESKSEFFCSMILNLFICWKSSDFGY